MSSFFHEYPYSNLHELNLDWVIKTVKNLDKKVNSLLSDSIESSIDEYFNKIMITAIYNEDEREIILRKEVVVGDGVHVYNAADNTMSIGE